MLNNSFLFFFFLYFFDNISHRVRHHLEQFILSRFSFWSFLKKFLSFLEFVCFMLFEEWCFQIFMWCEVFILNFLVILLDFFYKFLVISFSLQECEVAVEFWYSPLWEEVYILWFNNFLWSLTFNNNYRVFGKWTAKFFNLNFYNLHARFSKHFSIGNDYFGVDIHRKCIFLCTFLNLSALYCLLLSCVSNDLHNPRE